MGFIFRGGNGGSDKVNRLLKAPVEPLSILTKKEEDRAR